MGRHSTPGKYVQVHGWCIGAAPRAGAECGAAGRGGDSAGGPGPELEPGWRATRSLSRQRPLGAGQAVPHDSARQGLTAGPRCQAEVPWSVREGLGRGEIKGVSLPLNSTAGRSPLRCSGQRQERPRPVRSRPVPSRLVQSGGRRNAALLAPSASKERDRRAGKSQSSRTGSPSG